MEITEIQYLKELLGSAIHYQEWETINEAIEFLDEFLEEEPIDE